MYIYIYIQAVFLEGAPAPRETGPHILSRPLAPECCGFLIRSRRVGAGLGYPAQRRQLAGTQKYNIQINLLQRFWSAYLFPPKTFYYSSGHMSALVDEDAGI